MPPKNVLLMCASGQLGGTEVRMLEGARLLTSLGHKVTVGVNAFPQAGAYRVMLDADGIANRLLVPPPLMNNWSSRYLHWARAEMLFRHQVAQIKPDLVHVFFPWLNQGLDHLWLAGRLNIPAVISAHNVFPAYNPSPWHRKHGRTAFRSLRGLYGVSNSATEHAAAAFAPLLPGPVNQRTIYNFVDMQRFQPSAEARRRIREELGIGADTEVVGSVGRFDKQKRPLHLVNVFSHVVKKRPDTHLLLIGEGQLRPDVEQRISELGLGDKVTILPFQKNIEAYFPVMDVHLLVSGNEGFGVVTAEAMACGVPAVGTNVTGTREVLDGTSAGRLPPLEDDEAIARAVTELLEQRAKDPAAMEQEARGHVDRHFSRTQWAQDMQAFYEAALS